MFQAALFEGKKVLVTGGGSGIGLCIARLFLTFGAKVWIASRSEIKLQNALQELSLLGNCEAYPVDIRDPASVQALAEYILEKDKSLDILINNAGGQFMSPAEKISLNGWQSVINNNLNGTWYMCSTFARLFFIPQQSGNIVNIIANIFRGFPGMAHTGAARAGVDNLTKTLAVEWAKYGLRINAIAPGIIQNSGLETYPEEIRNRTLKEAPKKIPLQRLGSNEDVAWLSLFLSSPMAGFITGETVYVDGGQRLWGDMWEL